MKMKYLLLPGAPMTAAAKGWRVTKAMGSLRPFAPMATATEACVLLVQDTMMPDAPTTAAMTGLRGKKGDGLIGAIRANGGGNRGVCSHDDEVVGMGVVVKHNGVVWAIRANGAGDRGARIVHDELGSQLVVGVGVHQPGPHDTP